MADFGHCDKYQRGTIAMMKDLEWLTVAKVSCIIN